MFMKQGAVLWILLVLWPTGVAVGRQEGRQDSEHLLKQEFHLHNMERLMTQQEEVLSWLRDLQQIKMPTEQLENERLAVQQRLEVLDHVLVQTIEEKKALNKASPTDDGEARAAASTSSQAVHIASIIQLFTMMVAAAVVYVAFKLVKLLVRVTPSATARVIGGTSGAIARAVQSVLDKVCMQWRPALTAIRGRRRRVVPKWGGGGLPLDHLLHANLLKRLGWIINDVLLLENALLTASLRFQLPARVTLLPSQIRRLRRAMRLFVLQQPGGMRELSCHSRQVLRAVELAASQRESILVVGIRQLFWMVKLTALLPCLTAKPVPFVSGMRAPVLWRVEESKKLRHARRQRQAGVTPRQSLKVRILNNLEAAEYHVTAHPNGGDFLSVVPPYHHFPIFADWLQQCAHDVAWAFWTSPTGRVAAAYFAKNGITRCHADWLRGCGVVLPSVQHTA